MAIATQQVPVGTTVVRLDPLSAAQVQRGSCLVRNRGTAAVYLGGPTVTTVNGFQLDAGEALPVDLQPADALYAIAASGTHTVHVMEVGSL